MESFMEGKTHSGYSKDGICSAGLSIENYQLKMRLEISEEALRHASGGWRITSAIFYQKAIDITQLQDVPSKSNP